MNIRNLSIGLSVLAISTLAIGAAGPSSDKYTLEVPGGLAFSACHTIVKNREFVFSEYAHR